jgi:aminopeptidase YwaD
MGGRATIRRCWWWSTLAAWAVLSGATPAVGVGQSTDTARPVARPAPYSAIAAAQRAARSAFDGDRARDIVAFMDQYFRLPGNAGFDASIQRVIRELEAAGYHNETEGTAGPLTYRLERRALRNPTWEPVSGSLRIVGKYQPLLRFSRNRNLMAINSFSTPPDGVEAEVIDVGPGTPGDFAGNNVRGKIVFGENSVSNLFTEAVVKRGALGVIAYRIPSFNRPQKNRDLISYASIPLNAEKNAWGLQLTTNAQDRLREALREGPVRVRIETETRVFESEELTLVADVRGATHPDERFVFSAHVQEAGANDNATGVAALSEVARVFAEGVRTGSFTPERTISMIWGDEISSTRRYLTEDPDRTRGVLWGLSLDMVGEDTDRTGGTFLIEKMPDPSAVWTRGNDAHTEWGGRPMSVDDLTPHYFNDFVLNRCLDQGLDNGWVVKTNPYEGGSDHVPFLRAGLPGLLLWHFTDQYYHTDADRVRNVSAETLTNVGVCAAVSAMTLTTADAGVVGALIEEVRRAAVERIEVERVLSVAAVAKGEDPTEQRRILEAWGAWYGDALAAMAEVEVGGSSRETSTRIQEAREAVAGATREAIISLSGRLPTG